MKTPFNNGNIFSQSNSFTQLALSVSLFLSGHLLVAQNASHDQNSVPINGNNCTSYGRGALQNNGLTDSHNTAVGWNTLNGNNGGNDNTATGAEAMGSNTTGSNNTANGRLALFINSTGSNNTAVGDSALYSNTANDNTALGTRALLRNAGGTRNTAVGNLALYSNTSATDNTAIGDSILFYNTTGIRNTGIGSGSLRSNVSGNNNVAIGYNALHQSVSGINNIAIGIYALRKNTGHHNIAIGSGAMSNNTSGLGNVACGLNALAANSTGLHNSAFGTSALNYNTTGGNNTGLGHSALYGCTTGGTNTAVGWSALWGTGFIGGIGNYNTGVGHLANVSVNGLNNVTALGAYATVNASNKIRFGDANVTVIEGQVAYTFPSDGRFKTDVREDDVKGLEFIMKLRPVVYNFDTKKFTEFLTKNMSSDIKEGYLAKDFKASTAIRQSGFIAQEVEKAAKEIGYDFNGVHKPDNENDNYSLAYSQFVVPLVKAVQQQQQMINTQNTTIDALKQEVEMLKQNNEVMADKLAVTSSVNQLSPEKSGFGVEQNEPNPFTHETTIKYTLPKSTTKAYLAVFDLSGKQIATFNIDNLNAGSIVITTEKLAAGIYLYTVVANGQALGTKRMMVADK